MALRGVTIEKTVLGTHSIYIGSFLKRQLSSGSYWKWLKLCKEAYIYSDNIAHQGEHE